MLPRASCFARLDKHLFDSFGLGPKEPRLEQARSRHLTLIGQCASPTWTRTGHCLTLGSSLAPPCLLTLGSSAGPLRCRFPDTAPRTCTGVCVERERARESVCMRACVSVYACVCRMPRARVCVRVHAVWPQRGGGECRVHIHAVRARQSL